MLPLLFKKLLADELSGVLKPVDVRYPLYVVFPLRYVCPVVANFKVAISAAVVVGKDKVVTDDCNELIDDVFVLTAVCKELIDDVFVLTAVCKVLAVAVNELIDVVLDNSIVFILSTLVFVV